MMALLKLRTSFVVNHPQVKSYSIQVLLYMKLLENYLYTAPEILLKT